MGEAKRRKKLDPNFGNQAIKENQSSNQLIRPTMIAYCPELDRDYERQKTHALWICKQPSDKYAFVVSQKLDLDFSVAIYLVEFIKEILQMSLDCDRNISDPERSVYLCKKNSQRAKQLGRLIDKVRGFEGMQFVACKIPKYDQSELNLCWDGIGQWEA